MAAKAIEVDKVGKKFSQSLRCMMRNAPIDVVRSILGMNRRSDRLRKGEFWAVDEVSFSLEQGTRMGLIGRNGSGKSTMLKLLNGILLPDKGSIHIRGRIGALIEVGAGFHPLLTGRENIFINGAILGMTTVEIRRKFDEIVAFADIGCFLDSPVKFYSSGMFVRLGFSVAVHAEPDVLLLDEVLAVGDYAFQKKCFDRLRAIVDMGTTVVLVSHSMAAIQGICPTALLMEQGRSIFLGDSREAVALYYQSASKDRTCPQNGSEGGKISHKEGGSKAVYLSDFEMLDDRMQPTQRIRSGSVLRFLLKLRTVNGGSEPLPRTAIRIIDVQTEELFANIQSPPSLLKKTEISGELSVQCDISCFNLVPGVYQIEVKMGGDGEHLYDIAVISEYLEVDWSGEIIRNMSTKGKVYLPGNWHVPEDIGTQTINQHQA